MIVFAKCHIDYPSRQISIISKSRNNRVNRPRKFYFNLIYLQEHGLCEAEVRQVATEMWVLAAARITAKGLISLKTTEDYRRYWEWLLSIFTWTPSDI